MLIPWRSAYDSTWYRPIFPTAKYRDLDPALREERRRAWNRPVTWPAYALLAAGFAIVLPGVRTFFRERQ